MVGAVCGLLVGLVFGTIVADTSGGDIQQLNDLAIMLFAVVPVSSFGVSARLLPVLLA